MMRVPRIFIVGFVLHLTTAFAWAQATAELSGRVTDESGGILPGVTVTATQTDTGFARTTVTDGTGTHVRASIEGPAYWTIDLALARHISIGTTQDLELRLETFNLLNHFNWGNPAAPVGQNTALLNFDAANFGRIQTQAGTPRILQFGIKYGF